MKPNSNVMEEFCSWTKEEEELLLKATLEHEDWNLISQIVKTKDPIQCMAKFLNLPLDEDESANDIEDETKRNILSKDTSTTSNKNNHGATLAISKVLYDMLKSYNPKVVKSALASLSAAMEEKDTDVKKSQDEETEIAGEFTNGNRTVSKNRRIQEAGLNLGLALMSNNVKEATKETELQTRLLLNDFVDLRLNLVESKIHRITEIEKLIDTERESLNVEREDLFQAIYKSMAYVPRSKGGGKKINEKMM